MNELENKETVRDAILAQSKKPAWRIAGIFVLVVLIVAGGIVILAQKSLPGEPLYTFKTNGIERIVEKTHLHSQNKAWYQVTKMKIRLDEVKQLAAKSNVDEKAITQLNAQITSHMTTLNSIVAESIDSAFPKTDLLYTLNEFTSVAGAIEAVGEHDSKLQTVGDASEDVRQAALSQYKARVKSFTQTETPQTVFSYIQEELMRVKNELGESTLSKEATRSSGNYLDRVEPALVKTDLYKAILSIGEAYRIIKVEKYSGVTELPTIKTPTNTASTTNSQATTTNLQSTTSLSQ